MNISQIIPHRLYDIGFIYKQFISLDQLGGLLAKIFLSQK